MSNARATGYAAQIAPHLRGFRHGDPRFVVAQWIVAGTLRLLADIRVFGLERCPASGSGPLILASNHLSYVDVPLLGAWTPRPPIFFSKVEVARWPVLGGVGAAFGAIFARRGEMDRQAIRDAFASLAAGQMLAVFPEGHRSHGEGLLPAQTGVALLAQRSGARVWPVAITGTEQIFKKARPQVTVTGGEPFNPVEAARAEYGETPDHQQVTDTIMRRVAALLPEEYRGAYR